MEERICKWGYAGKVYDKSGGQQGIHLAVGPLNYFGRTNRLHQFMIKAPIFQKEKLPTWHGSIFIISFCSSASEQIEQISGSVSIPLIVAPHTA
jgi:hypothetical protein